MIDIDALKQDKRPQSSTIVHALIDRLEAAEADALEQARLNGMGSEREAALMAKLEAAENDAAHQKALAESALRVAEGWEKWFAARARNPDRITLEEAFAAGARPQPAPSFADAYQGAMEEVAIWKKRALEAEDLNRKFSAVKSTDLRIWGNPHSLSPIVAKPDTTRGVVETGSASPAHRHKEKRND